MIEFLSQTGKCAAVVGFLVPPVFLHTATQRDLLPDLRAHRVGEHDLGQIGFDGADTAARRQRADVDHQHLVLGQLLDLHTHSNSVKVWCWFAGLMLDYTRPGFYLGSLLVSLCADTQQPSEQEVGDLQLGEDLWQRSHGAQHLAHHPVSSTQRRVDLCAHTCAQNT